MAGLKNIFAVVVLVLFLVISGCGHKVIGTAGEKIDRGDLAKVKVGQTTKSELIEMFGPPTEKWTSQDGRRESLTYSHAKTKINTIELFLWQATDVNIDKKSVVFELQDGVVDSYRRK